MADQSKHKVGGGYPLAAGDRPSHPDELPRFDVLKAERLSLELGPASTSRLADSGPEVQLLQKLLVICGCELAFSGNYDKATYDAVRKLQLRYHLPMTGRIDAKTRENFNGLIAAARELEATARKLWYLVYPYRKQLGFPIEGESALVVQAWLKDLLEAVRQDQSAEGYPPQLSVHPGRPLLQNLLGPPGQMGVLSHGLEVTRLQEALQALGYNLRVNHSFDLQTFDCLKQFQLAQGLPVSGLADGHTRNQLNLHLQARYEREKVWEGMVEVVHGFQREHGLLTNAALEARIHEELRQLLEEAVLPIRCQLGPLQRQGLQHIGPDVLLLKCFLIQEGHELEADLAFDAATVQALRAFQKQHKLAVSGYLDAASLDFINQLRRQLGVGAQINAAGDADLIS